MFKKIAKKTVYRHLKWRQGLVAMSNGDRHTWQLATCTRLNVDKYTCRQFKWR